MRAGLVGGSMILYTPLYKLRRKISRLMHIIFITESRDMIGVKPIKEIISSLFVWPLVSVEQFNETDFQWRHVLPKILAILPENILFNIGIDYEDNPNNTTMLYVNVYTILHEDFY